MVPPVDEYLLQNGQMDDSPAEIFPYSRQGFSHILDEMDRWMLLRWQLPILWRDGQKKVAQAQPLKLM